MAKTIIVGGYGPGISTAVAEKFGGEGFQVAIVARNADKLGDGVKALQAKGIKAAAFSTELGDTDAVRALVGKVRATLGPITVLHWNAYSGDAGDLLTAEPAAIRRALDVAVVGLIVAVQEALADLKAQKGGVLVTNGGFGYVDPAVDAYAVQSSNMGLAMANAAKHKLVGMLAEKLRGEGVYVGEVMVRAGVKGTPWDRGNATLDASTVANKFWELYQARGDVRAALG
jgi:NAD(P)-dependent dehydrogenase (short-subunit alcohol dehydrogenase family)